MKPPEHLETQRLHLRRPVIGDADAIFREYAHDPEVTRFLVWRPHSSISDTEAFLRRCENVWSEESAFPLVLIEKETQQLIGMIELRMEGFKAEIGYVLARSRWGKGFMLEAVRQLIQWAFQQKEIYRIWAACDLENKASARVLEKSGMKFEGVLRRWTVHPNLSEEPRDSYCYAITK